MYSQRAWTHCYVDAMGRSHLGSVEGGATGAARMGPDAQLPTGFPVSHPQSRVNRPPWALGRAPWIRTEPSTTLHPVHTMMMMMTDLEE